MLKIKTDRLTWVASDKWISYVVLDARADRVVVDNSALGIFTANPDARVDTLVPDTGLFVRTVFVVGTLRSAAAVRIAEVFRITSANTSRSGNTRA